MFSKKGTIRSKVLEYELGNLGFTLIELLIVIAICGSLSLIFLAILSNKFEGKNYKICNDVGCEYIDSYTKEANCVFLTEKEKRICGDYTIEKINIEE